ncbi:hypothetical protein ACN4EE_00915 [Geminocystis sp. CENA526]|uniref:hypothetical protein n=1 Tax=Geminocystis sp. CENA526 TaxID=1355871 RepID=UPI003D6E1B26
MQLKEKYITDVEGNPIGIILDIKEYQKLLEESEELEAIKAYDLAVSTDDDEIPFETAIAMIENRSQ